MPSLSVRVAAVTAAARADHVDRCHWCGALETAGRGRHATRVTAASGNPAAPRTPGGSLLSVHEARTIRVTTMWEKVHEIRVPSGMTAEDAAETIEEGFTPDWFMDQITNADARLKEWAVGGDGPVERDRARGLEEDDHLLMLTLIDFIETTDANMRTLPGVVGISPEARLGIKHLRARIRGVL